MTIRKQYSLKKNNTFGIDVTAKEFITFETELDAVEWIRKNKPAPQNILVLGGGSNFLFTKDIDKTVLYPNIQGIKAVKETANSVFVEIGAGVVWDDLVEHTVTNNWGGVENLSLIPGNVGAAPVQNIGAYGVEVKDCFHQLTAIELATGKIHEFNKVECDLSYRNSFFKQVGKGKYLVTSVTLELYKNPKANLSYRALKEYFESNPNPSIQEVRKGIIEIRRSKLPEPEEIGNAGSFFKNPIVDKRTVESLLDEYPDLVYFPLPNGEMKLAAGWLIENIGMKGYREGDAGVYEKQALVLVNYGNATGQEIHMLSMQIRSAVFKEFGVFLEPEVNIIR